VAQLFNAAAEKSDHTTYSGITMQLITDDGYFRRGNFGGLLIRSMVSILIIYSPDGTNVDGSRCGEFGGIGSV